MERKWQAAPIWGEKGGSCGEGRYLEVRCITIGLRGRAEASCTIGQVRNCLLGEGALDDVGVIAVLLWGRGQLHLHMVTYFHACTQNISALVTLMTGGSIYTQKSAFKGK